MLRKTVDLCQLGVHRTAAFDCARQERTSSKSATISAVQHSPDRRLRKPLTASTTARRSTAPSRCCYRCGPPDHIASAADYPAAHAKCHSCDKIGHFLKCVTRSTKLQFINLSRLQVTPWRRMATATTLCLQLRLQQLSEPSPSTTFALIFS